MTVFSSMSESLVNCDDSALKSKVNAALDANIPAADILKKGLIPGMDIVGDKMESGDMFIPEVLMAAQAMASCVAVLKPLLADEESITST
jgi:5-methyltetrahydrofolate--homocysteine methyltransferase